MKWFKRFSWLAAWSVWLWLGFGLYRELPRDLGRVERQLPFAANEAAVAFIDDTHRLVSHERGNETPLGGRSFLKVYDAAAGGLLHSMDSSNAWMPEDQVRRGWLFEAERSAARGSLTITNLMTGERRKSSDGRSEIGGIHPSEPWAAFSERDGGVGGESRLFVVELQTGKELFVRPYIAERIAVKQPIFAADDDRLLVPAHSADVNQPNHMPSHVEVWNLAGEPRLERVIEFGRQSGEIKDIAAGRMAADGWLSVGALDVFDLASGKRLLSKSPSMFYFGVGIYQGSIFLSRDGKAVLADSPVSLHEIDTGRILWSAGANEAIGTKKVGNAFSVEERWTMPLADISLEKFATVAERDLNTGNLLCRHWKKDAASLAFRSTDGTIVADDRGIIRRLPLLVNWPLLAFCQTILSMPLVLLWAVIRWRHLRKRRLAT